MRIPRRVKIGAIWWTVKFVPSSDIDDETLHSGSQSELTQVIKLNKEAKREMQEATFLHEVLHCIDNELGHDIVEMLSSALYQVLKENRMVSERSKK